MNNSRKLLCRNLYGLPVFIFIWLSLFSNLQADESAIDLIEHPTGALPLSETQMKHIEAHWPRILGVRPNKYGTARIQAHLNEKGLALAGAEAVADCADEFITNKNIDTDAFAAAEGPLGEVGLPSSVDNSKLACFPPIGNQGSLGSCVGWASTYYQATHEYGLLNGINNKISDQNIRSPKWTYNMINWGQNNGSYPTSAYELLSTNGAPALQDFPYDANYREWDLNPQDWISALSYRMNPPSFFTIEGPSDIDKLKQILNNGHVVTFTTFAYSWQFTNVLADPAQLNNPYAGQHAISWVKGFEGGHHATIVGYDDHIWIDVNGNGRVDSGEKGAFLIANSWGTNWKNKGFCWISYDAFYKSSGVVNGPNANRAQAASMLFTITPKSAHYTPKAIAKFSLTQAVRNQLKLALGVSNTDATVPTKKFISGALTEDGGAFAFDGQSPHVETATFVLDATDLLPATNIYQKYYLIAEDTISGNPTTLNNYSIVDLVNNKEVFYNGDVPFTFDRSVTQPNIIFQQTKETPDTLPPEISITYPTNIDTIQGTIAVTVNVKDNVKVTKVEFYVDSKLLNTDTTAPFVLLLDTTQLSNGLHTLMAIAYDDAGNQARDMVTVTVQQQIPDTLPPSINIIYPANLTTINGTIVVSASVKDNIKVAKVELYVDSKLLNTDITSPFLISLDTTKLTNGQHTITAVAYDNAGNKAQHSISVNVQNASLFPSYLFHAQYMRSGWGTGAEFASILRNIGSTPLRSFKVKILVPPTQIDIWNVAIIESDSKSVTIGLPIWKKTLEPGEVLSYGFVVHPEMTPKVVFISATR